MFGYRVPRPDEAMLVSGSKVKGGAPFQVVVGHGMRIGMNRRARFLTLAMQESEVQEECVTKQGIRIVVKAVIAFKVGADDESIINAGQRFVSDSDQMPTLVGRIFAGHLRSIVGSMTVEEIVTERQKLATEVLDGSKGEMAKIGLVVDAFQIQEVQDRTGYIDQMAAPHRASIEQAAKIAQAQADQAAAEADQASQQKQVGYARMTTIAKAEADAEIAGAQQEATRKQVEAERLTTVARVDAERQTSVAKAKAKAEVDRAQAEAEQTGPLARATNQQAVVTAQTELAKQNAVLKEQQLEAEVIKPARADAEKIKVTAEANAYKVQQEATAMATSGRVALDQQIIAQLPQIVKEAAGGLAGANVTVLNGADGLTDLVGSLISQVTAVMDVARKLRGDTDGYALPQTPSTVQETTRRTAK